MKFHLIACNTLIARGSRTAHCSSNMFEVLRYSLAIFDENRIIGQLHYVDKGFVQYLQDHDGSLGLFGTGGIIIKSSSYFELEEKYIRLCSIEEPAHPITTWIPTHCSPKQAIAAIDQALAECVKDYRASLAKKDPVSKCTRSL